MKIPFLGQKKKLSANMFSKSFSANLAETMHGQLNLFSFLSG